MTRELRDSGLTVGRRRTAHLMRENGLRLAEQEPVAVKDNVLAETG